MSEIRPRYAQVKCPDHGDVGLTEQQYVDQMKELPNHPFECPICHQPAVFDEQYWQEQHIASRIDDPEMEG